MSLIILYGIKDNVKDVTEICLQKLTYNNIITIPNGDNDRAKYFTDHLIGIEKQIFIIINNEIYEYNQSYIIKINLENCTITTENNTDNNIENNIDNKIKNIHNKLQIKYGNLQDELPEQKMAVRYLTGNEKVLEIGSNIGRNSLVIASIVDNNNFVSLECDENIAEQLKENRDINNYTFHIESSALSKRKLIQKDWDTKPSDILEPGYTWVNTINLDELNSKYNIIFDTLVLDCEGAFYYILVDMPEILNNIQLIIMENDYYDISHKIFVDSVLEKYNFYNDYKEAGGWGCCYNNFFEVWKKST
jgi:FkbM family methyltransferase